MASALLMRTSQAGALAGQHASKPAVCPKPALARVMCPGSRLVLTRFQPSSVDHLTTPYVTLKEVLQDLDMLVPPMSGDNYKGLHGRIGVIGGDTMYTGAPYFSAMAALQTGADMSFVFCSPAAATPIKSYSPDLIVVPALVDSRTAKGDTPALLEALRKARLTALVVGPGLGVDTPQERAQLEAVLKWGRSEGLPMVIDGSALRHLAKDPSLIKGYDKAILTPNVAELGDLAAGLGIPVSGPISYEWQVKVPEVAKALQGPTLVAKGSKDVVSDGNITLVCDANSSPKRAGGMGDVMAGAVAAYASWAQLHDCMPTGECPMSFPLMLLAGYGGALVTREASMSAFNKKRHGLRAGDVLQYLPSAVYDIEQP